MGETWYRYEDVAYAAPVGFGESSGPGSVEIQLREFEVLRQTPKGVWLNMWLGGFNSVGQPDQRFVLRDARRRFACPTLAEARESFVARKRRQLAIYKACVRRAQSAIDAIETWVGTWNDPPASIVP